MAVDSLDSADKLEPTLGLNLWQMSLHLSLIGCKVAGHDAESDRRHKCTVEDEHLEFRVSSLY